MVHRLTDDGTALSADELSAASPAADADRAWLLAGADPAAAERLAAAVLAATDAPAVRSVALRARGFAALELRDVASAMPDLRAALEAAHAAGDAALLAEAEAVHALALHYDGQGEAALGGARAAVARGPGRPRPALVEALVLERLGRDDDALAAYARAEALAVEQDDLQVLARLRCNRGVLRIYRGLLDEADADLSSAESLCAQAGITRLGVLVRANRGFLAAQRGDLVTALQRLDGERAAMAAAGPLRAGVHELDRCEVLLAAGLPRDAMDAGLTAIAALHAAGLPLEAAEARVVTAQAALRAGEVDTAAGLARAALPEVTAQGRPAWIGLAREALLQIDRRTSPPSAALLAEAGAVAELLAGVGWPARAARVRIVQIELACELADLPAAQAAAAALDDAALAEPAAVIGRHHARALLRRATADPGGARAELRDGWEVFTQHRASLGATELRVGALTHAVELARLGVELAEEAGDVTGLLAWSERRRSGLLAHPPTHAPDDAELARLLGRLRRTSADLESAVRGQADTGELRARRSGLEEQVRRRAQFVPADRSVAAPQLAHIAALRAALGPRRMLVAYEAVGDRLCAIVIGSGAAGSAGAADARLVDLGPLAAATAHAAPLRHTLARLADAALPEPLRAAARARVDTSIAALRELLLAPLPGLGDAEALVVVPTGGLHALPWAALLPERPVSLAPSASLWLRAVARPRATDAGGLLLAAGPGLDHAGPELTEIAALRAAAHPVLLAGAAATAPAVLAAARTADTVHLACHGRFRADNPAFSTLSFHDGPLGAFELERLQPAPALIVLSACDAALGGAAAGDDLVGLTANLLRAGTATVVASMLPVPDAAARRLVVRLHEGLARGLAPADALHRARRDGPEADDDDRVAAAGFGLLGAG